MGVPKFFRWLSSKCPSLVTTIDGDQNITQSIEHFFIDMNGILYLCKEQLQRKKQNLKSSPLSSFHDTNSTMNDDPSGGDYSVNAFPTLDELLKSSKEEDELIMSLFFYIEELVFRVKPTKTLMIAIDGVAPMAKVQQQRHRRWHGYVKKAKLEKSKQSSNLSTDASTSSLKTDKHRQSNLSNKNYPQTCEIIVDGNDLDDNDDDDKDDDDDDENVKKKKLSASEKAKLKAPPKEEIYLQTVSTMTDKQSEMNFTPGTHFMCKLTNHMKYFIRRKIQDDKLWQKDSLSILLSGSEIPGEGEHKIMDYIREYKQDHNNLCNQETYVMYGMDTDLIMLSLATHLPHFYLLREHVFVDTVFTKYAKSRNKKYLKYQQKILKKKEQGKIDKRKFQLFNIRSLREYINYEFRDVRFLNTVETFNLERVIDDFILMLFLCGNDFLPCVPTLDIGEGSLDQFFSLYKEMLPKFGGYITDMTQQRSHLESFTTIDSIGESNKHDINNMINFHRLQQYIYALSQNESKILNNQLKYQSCFKVVKNLSFQKQQQKKQQQQKQKESTKPSVEMKKNTQTTSNFKLIESCLSKEYKNLVSVIDQSQSEILNCNDDLKRFLLVSSLIPSSYTSDETLPISAAKINTITDDQLLIKLSFKKDVIISSILLTTLKSSPLSSVKLYVNRPSFEFNDLNTVQCAQEINDISLSSNEQSSQKSLEIPLTSTKFKSVSHLTIFLSGTIKSNTTTLTRCVLFGYQDALAQVSEAHSLNQQKLTKKEQKIKTSELMHKHQIAHDHSHSHSHHQQHSDEHGHPKTSATNTTSTSKSVQKSISKQLKNQSAELLIFPQSMKITKKNTNKEKAEQIDYVELDLDKYKDQFYRVKNDIPTEEKKSNMIHSYLQGIIWNLIYYYRGLPSWSWYYPYYYAPFASDISFYLPKWIKESPQKLQDLYGLDNESKPLLPFELLLSVLPPSSCHHLPAKYHPLYADSNLFPKDPSSILVDREGKREIWDYILHVPFISRDGIQNAMARVAKEQFMDIEEDQNEKERNEQSQYGTFYCFSYDSSLEGEEIYKSTIPSLLPDIDNPKCKVRKCSLSHPKMNLRE